MSWFYRKEVTWFLFGCLCITGLTAHWQATWYIEVRSNRFNPKPKIENEAKLSRQLNVSMNNSSTEPICEPRKHFVYIKMHKTGSTTMRGILSRFTDKHALPKTRAAVYPFIGGYPGRIDGRFLLEQVDGKWHQVNTSARTEVNIYDHILFDAQSSRAMMSNDIVFFTTLRQPWNQFQSTYHFYYHNAHVPRNLRANCYLYPFYHIARGQQLSIFDYLLRAGTSLNSSVPWFFRSNNFQSFDLGLEPTLTDDNEIENEIKKLSTELDLVMITEYFEESLILLKESREINELGTGDLGEQISLHKLSIGSRRPVKTCTNWRLYQKATLELMCWDWSDLMYTLVNSRKYTKHMLDENPMATTIFHRLFKMDLSLYKHFNDTLWRKIDTYGWERMAKDVSKLRELQSKYLQDQLTKKKRDVKKKNVNSHDPRKIPKKLAPVDTFRKLTQAEMVEILREKITIQSDFLAPELAKELAEYMVDNHGGCPF